MTDPNSILTPGTPASPAKFNYPTVNRGGNVYSLPRVKVSEAVAAVPEKTFVQMILTDLPARIQAGEARTAAGDLEGGRKDAAFVQSFIAEHGDTLAEFSGFQGTNPLGREIAAASMSLLNNKATERLNAMLLSDDTKIAATDRTARLMGANKEFTGLLHGRDANDPRAIARLRSIESMSNSTPQPGSRSPRTGAAVPGQPEDPLAQPEVSPYANVADIGNRYAVYADKMEALIQAKAPAGTIGPEGGGMILDPLFRAGDQEVYGGALADFASTYAGIAKEDTPEIARRKLAESGNKVLGYAAALGNGSVDYRQKLIPALDGMKDFFKGDLTGKETVIRRSLESIAPVLTAAETRGRPVDSATVATLARMEASRITGDTSALSPSEKATFAEVQRVDQATSDTNLRISQDITLPPSVQGSGLSESGKPVSISPFGDATFPLLVAQKSAIQSAATLAKLDLASGGAKNFKDAFVRHSRGELGSAIMMQTGRSREDAEAGADIQARYIADNPGVDLRTLPEDIVRKWGATANQLAMQDAQAKLDSPVPGDSKDGYAAADAVVSTWRKNAAMPGGGTSSYDLKIYDTLANSGDQKWDSLYFGVRKVNDGLVSDITRGGSLAGKYIASLPVGYIVDPARAGDISEAITSAISSDLARLATRTATKVNPEALGAMGKLIAAQFIASAKNMPKISAAAADKATSDVPLNRLFGSDDAAVNAISTYEYQTTASDPLARKTPATAGGPQGLGGRATDTYTASVSDSQKALSRILTVGVLGEAAGGLTAGSSMAKFAIDTVKIPAVVGSVAGLGVGGVKLAAAGVAGYETGQALTAAASAASVAAKAIAASQAAAAAAAAAPADAALAAAAATASEYAAAAELAAEAAAAGPAGYGASSALGRGLLSKALPIASVPLAYAGVLAWAHHEITTAEVQPINAVNLGARLTKYAAAFAVADQVAVPYTPEKNTRDLGKAERLTERLYPRERGLPEKNTRDLGKAELTVAGDFQAPLLPGQSRVLSPLSAEGRKLVLADRADKSARTGGMVNAPFDYLQPGDGFARGLSTLMEAHKNSVRPVENAATQGLLTGLQDKLTGVGHTYASDARAFATQVLSENPDMSHRDARMLVNKAIRAAIQADAETKGRSEVEKELRHQKFSKELILFKAQAGAAMDSTSGDTAIAE